MIDWSRIEHIRPTNSQILRYSKGLPQCEYCVTSYQHMNWAFKEMGVERVATVGLHCSSQDFTILVECCQTVVEAEKLFYVVEDVPVKKKWWQWK